MKRNRLAALVVAFLCTPACKEGGSTGGGGGESMSPARPSPRARPTARRPPARRIPKAGPKLLKLWATGGLDVPESVLFDATRKHLYVSCINGKPTQVNGQGYIAQLSLQGKILKHKWATGFDAPKGMGLHGGTLYVTDITRLHAVDSSSGRILRTIRHPAAKFLNDIAVDDKGRVYVSDMVTSMIHVLNKDKLAPVIDLKAYRGANGMLWQDGALLVGTGKGIVRVNPEDRSAKLVVPVPGFGLIDGLRPESPSRYIISSWKGRIRLIERTKTGLGKVTRLLDTTAQRIQSADLEYVRDKRLLLVPTFFNNKVIAYRLR